MIDPAASVWNSLEVLKLIVAALTPILVALGGYWINKRLKSLEAAQWAQQKVIERRIKAYDELASGLNQLLCFFTYVGSWKEIIPPDLISLKRKLDERAYVSAPLFDRDFIGIYVAFMEGCCFKTMGGWGQDAKLRTLLDRRKQALGEAWAPAWDAYFAPRSEAVAPDEIRTAYTKLMAYLAAAIGATEVDAHILGPGRLPANYDTRRVRVLSRTPDADGGP
jgi:hypothetical protein